MAFEVHEASPQATDLVCDPLAHASIPGRQDFAIMAHQGAGCEQASPGSSETRANVNPQPHSAGAQRHRKGTVARGKARTKKTLGSVLRARRRDLQLTQREVALKLGVKPAHIAYLELDHRRPSLSLLSRIAEVLDLDRERLILLSHPEARSFISGAQKCEAARHKDQAWRDFKRNKSVLSRYKVSRKEMKVLSQVALLGRVVAPRNFLFILNSIRQAVEDEEV